MWLLACDDSAVQQPVASVVDSAPPPDTLVIAVDAEPRNLLSPFAGSEVERQVLDLIGAPLLTADFDCGLDFRPRFARNFAWSEDGRTLAMELRDDVRWSDGDVVDAQDFVAAFQLLDRAAPQVRAVDATHLEFAFAEQGDPAARLAQVALLAPVPAHVLGGIDANAMRAHPLNTERPLASGPWVVAAWTPGEGLVLEPNPGWPGPRPQLARVTLRLVAEEGERVRELERGTVDLVDDIRLADADRLATASDLRTVRRADRGQHDVFWNTVDPRARAEREGAAAAKGRPAPDTPLAPHPLFGSATVRRALSSAIDVEAMLRDVARSPRSGEVYGRPSVGAVSPSLCGYHNDALLPIPYDPDVATAALGRAGWVDNNGDGTLERAGQTFRFTLSVPAGSDARRRLAELVQANLATVGVDAQLEFVEAGALATRLRAGQFDAVLSGWPGHLALDPAAAWGAEGPFALTGYRNPRVDALLGRGLQSSDQARAQATWREYQSLVYADQPWTFLLWADEIVAVSRRFDNTTIDELGPYRRVEEWTVAPSKVKRPPS